MTLTTRLAEVYALLDGATNLADEFAGSIVYGAEALAMHTRAADARNEAADAALSFLRTFRAEMEAQARERDGLRELLHNGQWIREEGKTFLMVRMPDGADLSCRAMRDAAIDTALRGAEGAG